MAQERFTKEDLIHLLRTIDEDLDRRIRIVLIGGTALTFLGIKDSTRDIDMNVPSKADYRELRRVLTALGFEGQAPRTWITDQGYNIDIFVGDYIFVISLLDDYMNLSKSVGEFHNIDLYVLNEYDLIITKLTRSDERDLDDIRTIFERTEIDHRRLIDRYKETLGDVSVVRDAKENLLYLFENFLPSIGINVEGEDLEVIREW
jgi:hypothetical protein